MSYRSTSEVIATKSVRAATAVLLAVTILVAITSGVFWARSLQVPATEPPRLVVGLGHESATWGAVLHVTHAWEQSRVDPSSNVTLMGGL